MESRGARHTLILRRVEKEDFANYSCYATNKLGKDRAYLTLRGETITIQFAFSISHMFFLFPGNPNPPVFNSQVLSKSQTSYTISWQTESNTPVDEYRLLYRKIQVSVENSKQLSR